jgi:hypothetical protein
MAKWEYRILKATSVDDETQKRMNLLGEEGWELVFFEVKGSPPPLLFYMIFKRQVSG